MNQFVTTGVTVGMFLLGAAFLIRLVFWDGGFASATYKRVQIVKVQNASNLSETVMVRLAPGLVTKLVGTKDGDIHPDASYVCAKITGAIDTQRTEAEFAPLSDCPLPVSTTLPRSGIATSPTASGTKTIRKITVGAGQKASTFPNGAAVRRQ